MHWRRDEKATRKIVADLVGVAKLKLKMFAREGVV